MRIVYCGSFRLPNYDAAAPRVLNNAKLFRNAGHSVKFISWGGRYRDADLCSDGKYRVDGFEYVITNEMDAVGGFFTKLRGRVQRGRKSFHMLQEMPEKPDLIIMYNADYWWTRKMLSYCQENHIKLANDITEWYDNNELHLVDIIPNAINMKWLQRKVKNKIVISSYLNNYYKESNNLQLPPLCDPTENKWSSEVDDERIKPFDGITLIYAGNPAKKDCVHTVINAVNLLAQEGKAIRFLILGITRDDYLQQYRHLLQSEKLHSNIVFLGRVSQDLIPAYYQKADFLVLLREPNRKNNMGFPTKFAESMTAGVPVICNATSDLKRYVIDGETGFIVNGFSLSDIMDCLQNQVLGCSKEKLALMKKETQKRNVCFACNSEAYKNKVKQFLDNLE